VKIIVVHKSCSFASSVS